MSLICFNSKGGDSLHIPTSRHLCTFSCSLQPFLALLHLIICLFLLFFPLCPSLHVSLSCSLLVSIVLKGDISAFSAVPGILTHSSLAFQQPLLPGFVLPDYLGLHLHTHTIPPHRRAVTLTQIGSCCWLTPQLNHYVLQQSFTSVITVLVQE